VFRFPVAFACILNAAKEKNKKAAKEFRTHWEFLDALSDAELKRVNT